MKGIKKNRSNRTIVVEETRLNNGSTGGTSSLSFPHWSIRPTVNKYHQTFYFSVFTSSYCNLSFWKFYLVFMFSQPTIQNYRYSNVASLLSFFNPLICNRICNLLRKNFIPSSTRLNHFISRISCALVLRQCFWRERSKGKFKQECLSALSGVCVLLD